MALLDLSLPQARTRTEAVRSYVARAAALHRQRAALRRLDDRALADIGVSRTDADLEASRPVWDVPDNWRE